MCEAESRYAATVRAVCKGTFPYLSFTKSERLELFGQLLSDEKYIVDVVDGSVESYGVECSMNGKVIYIGDKVHYKVSLLADYYNDKAMLETSNPGRSNAVSPLEAWKIDRVLSQVHKHLIARDKALTPAEIRQALYDRNAKLAVFGKSEVYVRQVSSMRLGWMIGIVDYFLGDTEGKKWLDPCAGWGDRLISSVAMGMEYRGYDPNTKLVAGHKKILQDFSNDGRDRRVVCSGFEDAELEDEYYDIVMTSPPYFDQEIYSNEPTQSVNKYPEFDSWFEGFLMQLMQSSIAAVKIGGYICININGSKSTQICKPLVERMSNVDEVEYLGCLFLTNGKSRDIFRPVFVWKKLDSY